MDDWYIMNPSKEELLDLLDNIHRIAEKYSIHIGLYEDLYDKEVKVVDKKLVIFDKSPQK